MDLLFTHQLESSMTHNKRVPSDQPYRNESAVCGAAKMSTLNIRLSSFFDFDELAKMASLSPFCKFWFRIKSGIFKLSKCTYQNSVMVTFTSDLVKFVIKPGN